MQAVRGANASLAAEPGDRWRQLRRLHHAHAGLPDAGARPGECGPGQGAGSGEPTAPLTDCLPDCCRPTVLERHQTTFLGWQAYIADNLRPRFWHITNMLAISASHSTSVKASVLPCQDEPFTGMQKAMRKSSLLPL